MVTNRNIELGDESIYPNEQVLKDILGESYDTYCKLLDLFDKNDMKYIWKYYKDGRAWLCKVQKKKRTIVWMSAWRGFMKATIYFPEKYVNGLFHLDISKDMIAKIRITKGVGRSKSCIFEVRDDTVLGDIEKVIQFKILNK